MLVSQINKCALGRIHYEFELSFRKSWSIWIEWQGQMFGAVQYGRRSAVKFSLFLVLVAQTQRHGNSWETIHNTPSSASGRNQNNQIIYADIWNAILAILIKNEIVIVTHIWFPLLRRRRRRKSISGICW